MYVPLVHGVDGEVAQEVVDRLRHGVDVARRAGHGLREHPAAGIEHPGGEIARLAHDGRERGAHQRLRLLLDDRDQAVPHDLHANGLQRVGAHRAVSSECGGFGGFGSRLRGGPSVARIVPDPAEARILPGDDDSSRVRHMGTELHREVDTASGMLFRIGHVGNRYYPGRTMCFRHVLPTRALTPASRADSKALVGMSPTRALTPAPGLLPSRMQYFSTY